MIVAFLQCQWFYERSIEHVRRTYERHGATPEGRAKCNHVYLFYRSLTGKRLRGAFGDLCETIIWEESSKHIATKSAGSFPPDIDHIRSVIEHFKPATVLAFGRVASDGVDSAMLRGGLNEFRYIEGPHPAARGDSVLRELARMAELFGRDA